MREAKEGRCHVTSQNLTGFETRLGMVKSLEPPRNGELLNDASHDVDVNSILQEAKKVLHYLVEQLGDPHILYRLGRSSGR
jgi:hypothetical protein